MLVAWDKLPSSKKRVGRLQLVAVGCAIGYGVYRVIKCINYQKTRENDAFPNDEHKMKEYSNIVDQMIFIDNMNFIRTHIISFMLSNQLRAAMRRVKTEHKIQSIINKYTKHYAIDTMSAAFGLDLAFNIALHYKTRPDIASKSIVTNIWIPVRALTDTVVTAMCALFDRIFFNHPSIEACTDPFFVWNHFMHYWFETVKLPIKWWIKSWILYILNPFGYFSSAVNYSAELIFGFKWNWSLFADEHRAKRYKHIQKAMTCFGFRFDYIFIMDQKAIDTRYNEIKNITLNENTKKLGQLEESYYILSALASYWMVRRLYAVNLWMYCLFVKSPDL